MKKPLYWILISIFGIIFLVSGFIVVRYLIEASESRQMQQDLIDMRPTTDLPSITTTAPTESTTEPAPSESSSETAPTEPIDTEPTVTEPTMLPDLVELYERNNHLVGWIYIPGTENKSQNFSGINYPVLQSPNEPEWHNFYLNHDFDRNLTGDGKDNNGHGWIYVREACDVFKPCDNIVIYGHNMADGTMFGQVVNYRYKSYYEEHKYIYFDTLYERQVYEVFAVFYTLGTSGEGYPYHYRNNFKDEADFDEFLNAIKGGDSRVKLYYYIDTTAEYGDKLLTLSTCWKPIGSDGKEEDGRMVVVAKRIG